MRQSLIFGAIVIAALGGCEPQQQSIGVFAPPDICPVLADFVTFCDYEHLSLQRSDSPVEDAASFPGIGVAVLEMPAGGERFELDRDRGAWRVWGGTPLGVQYGLADLLEQIGFRFYHPFQTRVPSRVLPPNELRQPGVIQQPAMRRRGLHLHTLHPIEGLDAFWIPGDARQESARRIVDWLVKNRGNHLQWAGLDNITRDPTAWADWRNHTRAIVDMAHVRGVTTGLGIQLFGTSNLQQAYDLIDEVELPFQPQLEERIPPVADGIGFDLFNLSFGEFSVADPDAFIDAVALTYDEIKRVAPSAEVSTVIHVGKDLVVEYEGQEMIYYFLTQFVERDLTPWVHTVMYFNLFDDAGGAYDHDTFAEHRDFLLSRLRAGEPVGYFPETAYWCAFDDSIPIYLPVYVPSRWRDIHELARRAEVGGFANLRDQVIFSSGWEWGYWQNDYATLRMSWSVPEQPGTVFAEMFAPFGPAGVQLGDILNELADVQYQKLIGDRLAPWLASRDVLMDMGYTALGIVSQPFRPFYEDIPTMAPAERADLRQHTWSGLVDLTNQTAALRDRVTALDLPTADPWIAEIRDGLAVDVLRSRFAADLLGAVLDFAEQRDNNTAVVDARRSLDEAEAIVARRHQHLWAPHPERLLSERANPTLYQYGYLLRADELCFWHRELAQVENLTQNGNSYVRGCDL